MLSTETNVINSSKKSTFHARLFGKMKFHRPIKSKLNVNYPSSQ